MYEDPDKFPTPVQESIIALLCFGSDAYAVAVAELLDPTFFEEPYRDLFQKALAYIDRYKKAPGKAHIDDVFGHVIHDPGNPKADLYRRLLMGLYRQSDDLNEQYVLDHVSTWKAEQTYKDLSIKIGRRFEQGRNSEGFLADLQRIVEEGSMRAESCIIDYGRLDVVNIGAEPDAVIPLREWLLGNVFCRGAMSCLLSDGGIGKTTLRILQLLSLASGRELTGEHVFRRSKVLYDCLEDDEPEIRRRVAAAMTYHNVTHREIDGFFYFAPIAAKDWKLLGKGDKSLEKRLIRTIRDLEIDLVCLDPLVKAHSCDENSNQEMDEVARSLAVIASECNVAVDFLHHISKGGQHVAGDAERARGASAVVNAARLVRTMTALTQEQAERFGIDEEERQFIRRIDRGKVNTVAPNERTQWFKLVGVPLDNGKGNKFYPQGDTVQTIECWTPPDVRESLSRELADAIIAEIGNGAGEGWLFSNHAAAGDRAAWKVVMRFAPDLPERQCREIVRRWIEGGVLEETEYKAPDWKWRKGLRVNPQG
jgi:hypothetical protein